MSKKHPTKPSLHRYCLQSLPRLALSLLLLVIEWLLFTLYEGSMELLLYLLLFTVLIEAAAFWLGYRSFCQHETAVRQLSLEQFQSSDEYLQEKRKWQQLKENEDFFALWAHQIKTPITSLNVMLQTEVPDIGSCRSETFRIENYVNMALNYLRFENLSNDITLQSINLEPLIRSSVKKFAPIFIHKHLKIELTDLNISVLSDEKWLSFVIEQLLSNSLKYTVTGGIHIYTETTGHDTELCIEDTGIGIRPEDIPRLFEKGFTGYNGRMDKKASGLGLYLSKGVCDKLGHQLTLTSNTPPAAMASDESNASSDSTADPGATARIRFAQDPIHTSDLAHF